MDQKTNTALTVVSGALKTRPEWLKALIQFESGWNPAARNPISGARGLIQFTNTTARNLGYFSADDLYSRFPTAESQLYGPVLSYLRPYSPFPTEQSLYMSVFYPAARNWPLWQEFPAAVQKVNPGIKTVQDYVNKVKRIKGKTISGGLALLLIAGLAYYLFTQQKGKTLWAHGKPQIAVMGQTAYNPIQGY